MTHEKTPNGEHRDGPEHDQGLPDAWEIPVSDGPFDLEPVIRPHEWES